MTTPIYVVTMYTLCTAGTYIRYVIIICTVNFDKPTTLTVGLGLVLTTCIRLRIIGKQKD